MKVNNQSGIKQYFQLIQKLYDKEESGLPLAIFRIFYGFVLLGEVYQLFYFRHMIFDVKPYIEPGAFDVTPFLVIWLISVVFIIIGLKTRAASIVNYVFTVMVLGLSFHVFPGSLFEYHVDTELLTVALLLMFIPLNRRLSLDRLLLKLKYSKINQEYSPKSTVSSLNYILLILVAALLYFDSIFYKFASPMWLQGLGVWLPASLPWATWIDLSFILNQKYIMLALGYLTLFFQVSYIFLIWIKKIKTIYLLIGIGLHVGIFFAFPIPWFALGMIALYVGMLPESFYQFFSHRLSKPIKNNLVFYYDEYCPLCNRLKWIIEFFDYKNNIIFKPVQTHASKEEALNNISPKELVENVYSVDSHKKVFFGINTYKELFLRVWVFKPFGLLLYLPPILWLGKKAYTYTAKNRIRSGCTEENCHISFSNLRKPIDIDSIKILNNLSVRQVFSAGIGLFIIFLMVSQFILIQKSYLMQRLYRSIGFDSVTISNLSYSYQKLVFPYTGLQAHVIFLDFHFNGYNKILRVAYENEDGTLTFLPIIQENGQASYYNTGRQWAYWTFRCSDPRFPLALFQTRVSRYLLFWGGKNNIDLKNSKFRLYVKHVKVPSHWEKDVLKNNLEAPWKTFGVIGWNEGKQYMNLKSTSKVQK